jgi:hypothetical protein
MQAAADSFEQLPDADYKGALSTILTDVNDLANAAPAPLPAGTFIDYATGEMWSGQIGAVMNQGSYASQVAGGASLTLTAAEPDAAPGAQTPTLANGQAISNWAPAQLPQLQTLEGDIPATHVGTPGDFLVDTDGSNPANSPQAWWGLLSNGVWNASSYQVGTNYAAESHDIGMLVAQTPDDEGSSAPLGQGQQLSILDVTTCLALFNSDCSEPTWADGAPDATYDLNNGWQMLSVNGRSLGGVWGNWSQDQSVCVSLDYWGNCNEDRDYPGITNNLTLPVLYYRAPTQSECYYWPSQATQGVSTTATDNGCPS